jgi:penicillin-binding protein 1A
MSRIRLNFFIIPLVCSIAFGYGFLVSLFNSRWVDFSVLENYNPGKPSILLDDAGVEWARFEIDRRRLVVLKEVPQHLIDSFLVSEDRNFFTHIGISWRGIIRSTLVNIRHGRIVQGASTITQQLVKLLFFDSSRTFKRKIKEQFVSLLVEHQFTKEQILETYLNHVYFGCGIYGVEAAARRFFNKTVCDLNVSESAVLASIVKSPGRYCPLLSPALSEKRRNLVLRLLTQQKMVDQKICNDFIAQPLQIYCGDGSQLAPHLKETIRQFLESKFGKQKLYRGGLIVKTTINCKIQKIAQQEFRKKFLQLKRDLGSTVDGGLISISAKTGEIKALVGGCSFSESKFNRALQARRQMGSIFKPIVYAAALQAGYDFAHIEVDEATDFSFGGRSWRPRNSTRTFSGSMTLAKALSLSNNIVTVKALMLAGCKNVVNLAEKFNLPGPIPAYPSISLGCVDVNLLEAVGAFNVFANGGVYVAPHYLKWVKNEWGAKVWREVETSQRVLSARVSGQVAKVLGIGTKRFLRRMKRTKLLAESIGKTGTTNDSRTCWFAGSTPELTTALYLGRDNNSSLGRGIYPVWTLFPIWINMYEKLIKDEQKFSYDPSLKEININWTTGREVSYCNHNTATILV